MRDTGRERERDRGGLKYQKESHISWVKVSFQEITSSFNYSWFPLLSSTYYTIATLHANRNRYYLRLSHYFLPGLPWTRVVYMPMGKFIAPTRTVALSFTFIFIIFRGNYLILLDGMYPTVLSWLLLLSWIAWFTSRRWDLELIAFTLNDDSLEFFRSEFCRNSRQIQTIYLPSKSITIWVELCGYK